MLSETDKYKLSIYVVEKHIHSTEYSDIFLTKSTLDEKFYIKKIYKNSNMYDLLLAVQSKKVRNSPRIYEVFYDDINTILIEEFIYGHTADSIKFTKSLLYKTIFAVLNFAEDIHSINIIHRDIKPSNIMITKDHRIYVIDLGIARFYNDNVKSDTTRYGTEGFAPPEQYGFQQTDFRSDIYSIGKTLESIASSNNININKAIISRAVAFDPGKRYSNIGSFRRVLFINRFFLATTVTVCIFVMLILYIITLKGSDKSADSFNEKITTDLFETTTDLFETTADLFETTTDIQTEFTTEITTNNTTQTTTVAQQPKTIDKQQSQPTTAQQTTTSNSPSKPETSSDNINIDLFLSESFPFSGVDSDDGTPVMSISNEESDKKASIKINNTTVNIHCVKSERHLTVDFSDSNGNTGSCSISISDEEFARSDYNVHSYQGYVFFYDFDGDNLSEIFVNFTDASYKYNAGGNLISLDGIKPYVYKNFNGLAFVEHSAESGFNVYQELIVMDYNVSKMNIASKPNNIDIPFISTRYVPENGNFAIYYGIDY